jgi:cytochrome P450
LAESYAEHLLARSRDEGPVLALDRNLVGIFDPSLALKVDVANSEGLEVAASLADLLSPARARTPLTWRETRMLLTERNRTLNTPRHLEALHARMRALIAAQAGHETDFTLLIERAAARSLVPLILAGLDSRAERAVIADLDSKLHRLLAPRGEVSMRTRVAGLIAQIVAGRMVSRALAARRKGDAPPQEDFAETILALTPRLGAARASYVVGSLLTAISGAPGSVAACMIYELTRHPEWHARIGAEMASLAPDELYASPPARKLAATSRFIREAMRLWAFPLITRRPVHHPIDIGAISLRPGQSYDLSAYVQHHSPDVWEDAECFDPDRWLPERRAAVAGAYVPFGFAARSCVGGSIGMSQLILFCQLATTEFAFEPDVARAASIGLEGVAAPVDFIGKVRARG